MDKLDTLTLFVRIVERGSFSAAAADLGVSRPVATAAIKALEVSLGARLLHRTTRHVRPADPAAARAAAVSRPLPGHYAADRRKRA